MKKCINIILWTMIFNISLIASNIRIKITDQSNLPIADAIISHGSGIQMSDSLGYFTLKQNQKLNEYKISKAGYKSLTVTETDLFKNKRVVLKRNKILMNSIYVKAKEEEITQQIRSGELIRIDNVNNKSLNSVADWLNTQQGLEIKGLELSGEKKTLSLGGHSSRHTVIMLDGIILNPTGQDVDLSMINNDRIESVEVIKNNAGIESGAGGIAGIIKIRSKRFSDESKLSVNSSAGSFNSIKNTMNFNTSINSSQLDLSYSLQKTDNDFPFYNRQLKKEDIRHNNNKFQQQFSLGLMIPINGYFADYQCNYMTYKNNLPGTYNYSQAFAGSFIKGYSLKNILNIKSSLFKATQEMILYSNTDRNNYQNLKTSIPFYHANTRNYQQVTGAKLALMIPFFSFENRNGLEYKNERFESTDILKPTAGIPMLTRDTYSGYTGLSKEIDYQLFELISQASVRMDYTKEFKNNYSWRIEQIIKYYASIPVEIYFNYGSSFSLPSFYDLYWKGDSQTAGNPDLKPETSIGYRTGLKIGDNPSIEQSYWKNDTRNLIYWFRSLTAWKPGNITDAKIQNFETQIKYCFLKYNHITASYNRTIAKDKSLREDGSPADFYNKFLIYTPEYQWKLSYNLSYHWLSQTMEYQATGKQYSTRDQIKAPLPSYEKWDSHTSVSYHFNAYEINLISSLYNIFDENYEIYDYIPEPGYHWQIMLKIQRKI